MIEQPCLGVRSSCSMLGFKDHEQRQQGTKCTVITISNSQKEPLVLLPCIILAMDFEGQHRNEELLSETIRQNLQEKNMNKVTV